MIVCIVITENYLSCFTILKILTVRKPVNASVKCFNYFQAKWDQIQLSIYRIMSFKKKRYVNFLATSQ